MMHKVQTVQAKRGYALPENQLENTVRTVSADTLATTQKAITAARRMLGTPIALQIGGDTLAVLPYALGRLANTFDKDTPLGILPRPDSLLVTWSGGYMRLKALDMPAHETPRVLDFDQLATLASTGDTGTEIAARILGDSVEEAKERKQLEKIDETWDECVLRGGNLYAWVHGESPRHYRYIGRDDTEARAAAAFKSAGKLQKAAKAYAKLGGDYAKEIRDLLIQAQAKVINAALDLSPDFDELKSTQTKYTEMFASQEGLPDDVLAAIKEQQQADDIWMNSMGTGQDDDTFNTYMEAKEKAKAIFIAWSKVDPSMKAWGYDKPNSAATVSTRLQAAIEAQGRLQSAKDTLEHLERQVFAVDNLNQALTVPGKLFQAPQKGATE